MKHFEEIFKNKYSLIVAFLFAMLAYGYLNYTSARVGSDQMVQLGTAVNFLEGNGFSQLNASEIGQVEQTKVLAWPYFYRILAVPVLLITNKNVELSFLLLGVFSFGLLLLATAFFIQQMPIKKPRWLIGLLFILAPFMLNPFKYPADSDALALAFTLFGLAYLFRYFFTTQKTKDLLLFAICVALLPQIRHAYVPQAIAFILFFLLLTIVHRKKVKMADLLSLVLPLISLAIAFSSPYFQSLSGKYLADPEAIARITEGTRTFLPRFYAPFFNSFFPDYILVTFLQRFPALYEKTAVPVLSLFALVSLVIIFAILYFFFVKTEEPKKLGSYFKYPKITETGLLFIAATHLVFYLFLYRSKFYFLEEILSPNLNYQSLAVVNRYFAPIHISIFILAVFYLIKYKHWFFKILVFSSLAFSLLHFTYLRTMVYHPTDRQANMDIVNLPEGSYNDIVKIGKLIKEEKKTKTTYFISGVEHGADNFRQIKPPIFAIANGAILLSPKADLKEALGDESISVLFSAQKDVRPPMEWNWDPLYEGRVYSLYKFSAKEE